jgi:hypothetical protein
MEASMTRRIPLAAVLLVLACAVFAAACGGDDEQASAPPKGEVEDQLGFDDAGILARQSRVEAVVRDCMKDQGFDYVPVDPVAQRAALFGSSRLSEEDFIRQFGYGISTVWGRATATADPNQRIRARLSGAEGRAYDRALWGENEGATFIDAVDRGDFSKLGGCTLKATEAAIGSSRTLTQLQSRLDEMEERMLQDQRMVRAIEAWSKCMADAGYRYEEPEEIDEDLYERAEAIVGTVPGQFATGPAPGVAPGPYDRAALAALQRDEVEIAVADFRCEEREIVPVEERVSPRYQEEFRQQNAALISQVKPVR